MCKPPYGVIIYVVSSFDKYASEIIKNKSIDNIDNSNLYNEKTFWPVFFKDLFSCEKSLLIMSPFISLNRTSQMIEYFRTLLTKGVNIKIFTRPPYQQGGKLSEHAEEVIRQLDSLGATVIQRRNMHQKVAIIDDFIVWEGS